jgi:hypothetical protein
VGVGDVMPPGYLHPEVVDLAERPDPRILVPAGPVDAEIAGRSKSIDRGLLGSPCIRSIESDVPRVEKPKPATLPKPMAIGEALRQATKTVPK